MAQTKAWEQEYKNPKLITRHPKPQSDTLKFIRWAKKEIGINFNGAKILDLGSGTGRNSNYLASLGADVIGYEISREAIKAAKNNLKNKTIKVDFRNESFGEKLNLEDKTIDIILDVISSNSLNERERETYLRECHRVLKKQGAMFVKTLLLDGDDNAKNLCQKFPGIEKDTYLLRELKLTERVFSEKDFLALYSQYFELKQIIKKTSYIPMNNQLYKRRFISAYLLNK